jgi:hypothetical protein
MKIGVDFCTRPFDFDGWIVALKKREFKELRGERPGTFENARSLQSDRNAIETAAKFEEGSRSASLGGSAFSQLWDRSGTRQSSDGRRTCCAVVGSLATSATGGLSKFLIPKSGRTPPLQGARLRSEGRKRENSLDTA